MKSKKIIDWVDTGIFPATIMLASGMSYDEIIKNLKQDNRYEWASGLKDDKSLIDSGSCLALKRTVENSLTKEQKILFYIIIKGNFAFTDYDYCMLAHEVLHICQFLLVDILDRNREYECEAYLHSHIMMQCLDKIRMSGCVVKKIKHSPK